jgi:hypothetical protein
LEIFFLLRTKFRFRSWVISWQGGSVNVGASFVDFQSFAATYCLGGKPVVKKRRRRQANETVINDVELTPLRLARLQQKP